MRAVGERLRQSPRKVGDRFVAKDAPRDDTEGFLVVPIKGQSNPKLSFRLPR